MGRKSREKRERRIAAEALAIEETLAAERRREEALLGAELGRRRGCLFCRQGDGGFTSREHIVPESLCSSDVVLPVGVVCDRCNHSVCSSLDAALLDFSPVAMMRTVYGVPSKRGKLPSVKFDNGSLETKAPGQLFLQLDSQKWRGPDIPQPGGRVKWSFTGQRHDLTPRRLSLLHRALVKMAVEFAWLDHGEEALLSDAFDRERDIVMHGKHRGYLVFPKTAVPHPRVQLTYARRWRTVDSKPLLAIGADIYGVVMVTDTRFPTPPGEVPEEAAILPF